MKATVEMMCGRYSVVGLEKPAINPVNDSLTNGKPVYELTYLHSFSSKTYKTLANAIRAIEKKGMEYVPFDSVIAVTAWD